MPLRRRPSSAGPTAPLRPAAPCGLAFALVCLACGGAEGPAAEHAKVERGRVERIVVATGTIEPATEVEVRPRIAGIIERIAVTEGDLVEPGELLVEIERDLLASQVEEARAAVGEAEVEVRYAGIDLERIQSLRDGGASSAQKLDEAKARHERGQAGLDRAQARLATLETQLGYASIRSTLEGRVLDVPVEEGSAVSPVTAVTGGTLLLSLAATDRLHLEGLVDENEVARIEPGQSARIRTEAFGDRVFEGSVRKIAPLGQRIQNVTYFEVEIDIVDAEAQLLRPRMSGDADIVTQVVEGALTLPETALHYRGDEIYVEIPNGAGPPLERLVEVGIVDGSRVEITGGVEEGEEVVLQ